MNSFTHTQAVQEEEKASFVRCFRISIIIFTFFTFFTLFSNGIIGKSKGIVTDTPWISFSFFSPLSYTFILSSPSTLIYINIFFLTFFFPFITLFRGLTQGFQGGKTTCEGIYSFFSGLFSITLIRTKKLALFPFLIF